MGPGRPSASGLVQRAPRRGEDVEEKRHRCRATAHPEPTDPGVPRPGEPVRTPHSLQRDALPSTAGQGPTSVADVVLIASVECTSHESVLEIGSDFIAVLYGARFEPLSSTFHYFCIVAIRWTA